MPVRKQTLLWWGREWAAQDMSEHVRRFIYSKRLSRGQHRYGEDADWGVLDWVHICATWRISHIKTHLFNLYSVIYVLTLKYFKLCSTKCPLYCTILTEPSVRRRCGHVKLLLILAPFPSSARVSSVNQALSS